MKKNLQNFISNQFSQPEILETRFSKKYICTDKTNKENHSVEAFLIFLETVIKKLLRIFNSKNHKYFSKNENQNNQIYKEIDKNFIETYKKNTQDSIINIGHATNLIKINEFNILTDPVFNHLNPILYRSKTKTDNIWENKATWEKIGLDAIIISHNHRDHVDTKTLKMLTKLSKQPILIVPEGDKKLFEKIGFKKVQELKWYEQIELENNSRKSTITAVAADHWSGRGLFDAEKSATSGYLINNLSNSNIFYFAGDTAKLSDKRIIDLAVTIFLINSEKNENFKNSIPHIINIEPDGPNYSRDDMKSTHQSIIESILSSFRLAISIKNLDQALKTEIQNRCGLNLDSMTHKQLFDKINLQITHHNKYELGPDRFNEGKNILQDKILPIFEKFKNSENKIDSLKLEFKNLLEKEKTRKTKDKIKILKYYDDWLYEEMGELLNLTQQILPIESQDEQFNFLIQYLQNIVEQSFPMINEFQEFDGLNIKSKSMN
jgi:L-ascorbate metabolism protein UlaG (beta-lactamase superfamily)